MAEKNDFEKLIQDGFGLSPEKKIYFNGFVVSMTPHDVILVLQNNNQPVAFLNTSHIIAKTLASKLQGIITGFENEAEMTIPTLDEIQEKLLRKSNADGSGNTQQD